MGLSLRARGLVKLSQHEMLDLAQGRSRQIVDKNDIARYLETGKLRQHMRLQVLRFYYAPCAPNDVSHRHLVPFGIKPADHAAFNHIGMLQQHPLDFRRIDVFAPGNDQVLLAVVHPEIAVRVAAADVAGAIPAIVQRLPRCFPITPIFRENVGTTHGDLARCVRRQLETGIIDQRRFAAQTREAG